MGRTFSRWLATFGIREGIGVRIGIGIGKPIRAGGLSLFAIVLGLAAGATEAPPADPGLVFEIDRGRSELRVRDARSGEVTDALRVVIGSPGHRTPVGHFDLQRVILNPAWKPGPEAKRAGAVPQPPSLDTPMGVAKIPFAAGGYALHGGGDPRLLGMPVSSGCVRVADADLLRVLAWLHQREALAGPLATEEGEVHRRFRRRARLVVE